MTLRIDEIVSAIPKSNVFADIGCDHGYVAKGVLDSGKCKVAIVSDISEKCLKKAQDLLADYIKEGRAKSVLSDGFNNLPKVDTALIAGMGGEEIIGILSAAKFLPENLLLQPMKNCDKVRSFVVKSGYAVIKDYVFESQKKFYNLIVLKKGKDSLTDEETEFGRTNLKEKPQAFINMLGEDIAKFTALAGGENVSPSAKEELLSRAERLKKYV